MNKPYKSCAYVENGTIFTKDGIGLNRPAILLDIAAGCTLSWGEYDHVNTRFQAMTSMLAENGFDNSPLFPHGCIMLVEPNSMAMTPEERCYMLVRCVEHTASGFHKELGRRVLENDNPVEWLRSETARVPIDLTR